MALEIFTVTGSDLDGLTHLNAIQILLTQLAKQVNSFNAQSSGNLRAVIVGMNYNETIATTATELNAVNPTPVIQNMTENQLTGQLSVTLAIPIRNDVDDSSGTVETSSRLSYGHMV